MPSRARAGYLRRDRCLRELFSIGRVHQNRITLPHLQNRHLQRRWREYRLIHADIPSDKYEKENGVETPRQFAPHVLILPSMTYVTKTFNLSALEGLSEKQINVHLALYEGYVKHVNLIMEKIKELTEVDAEGNAYLIAELRRRFAFEFDGMRMHEYYFEQFEGGQTSLTSSSALGKAVAEKYGEQGLVAHITRSRGESWHRLGRRVQRLCREDASYGVCERPRGRTARRTADSARAGPLGACVYGGLCPGRKEKLC